MKTLLVISDSHGELKDVERVLNQEKYDISIHLGDSGASVEWAKKNFDYFLSGNNDSYHFNVNEQVVKVEDVTFALTHGDNYEATIREMVKFNERVSRYKLLKLCRDIQANVILYGHSHIKDDTKLSNYRIINPGSFSYPRDDRKGTYLILKVNKNELEKVEFKEVTKK